MRSQEPDQTDPGDDNPNDDQSPTRMLHGSFLSRLLRLDFLFLHLLLEVGELGRWLSWRLALVFGHNGGPPKSILSGLAEDR